MMTTIQNERSQLRKLRMRMVVTKDKVSFDSILSVSSELWTHGCYRTRICRIVERCQGTGELSFHF